MLFKALVKSGSKIKITAVDNTIEFLYKEIRPIYNPDASESQAMLQSKISEVGMKLDENVIELLSG